MCRSKRRVFHLHTAALPACIEDIKNTQPALFSFTYQTIHQTDRVYFERSATCDIEITYSLLEGDTVYLEDGCVERNVVIDGQYYTLYPAVIGPATFQDRSPPLPKIDGDDLPKTMTVVVDGPSSTTAVVDFVASAKDDCDRNPSAEADPPSGHAFPAGTTEVTVTATDNVNNQRVGTLTIVVEPWTNECADGELNDCHADATCTDVRYGYECACKSGFTGNGTDCQESEEEEVSESPSASASPSSRPSESPSLTGRPSSMPSDTPSVTDRPSSIPSGLPSASSKPSVWPRAGTAPPVSYRPWPESA